MPGLGPSWGARLAFPSNGAETPTFLQSEDEESERQSKHHHAEKFNLQVLSVSNINLVTRKCGFQSFRAHMRQSPTPHRDSFGAGWPGWSGWSGTRLLPAAPPRPRDPSSFLGFVYRERSSPGQQLPPNDTLSTAAEGTSKALL